MKTNQVFWAVFLTTLALLIAGCAGTTGSGKVLFRLSPDGVYLNWEDAKAKFRQADGTYMVPVEYLVGLAPDSVALVFEGEYWDTVGEHHVCILVLNQEDYTNACETVLEDGVEYFHINQGSFWGYPLDENGWAADDLLHLFAWNKWQNGQKQTPKKEWPIFVHMTTGDLSYDPGEEPDLTEIQQVYRDQAEEDRCPADAQPVLEEPYADSTGGHAVVGAPGAYNCLTLFVGRRSEGGPVVALYWLGAKDEFGYWSEDASIYLIPLGWGEEDTQDWVDANFDVDVDVSPL